MKYDTILDYIEWMKDFPIFGTGFTEVDAVVLSLITYFDMDVMFRDDSEVYLRDCRKMIDSGELCVEIVGKDAGYREVLEAAVGSNRYGSLRMSDYVDVHREDPPLQFAAITFHDEDISFVSYRGTDGTLAGWREDFIVSFTRSDAQELALKYAQDVIKPGRRYIVGGHSKGGNLALYAASLIDSERFDAIERIYNLDGPGLCSDVIDMDTVNYIADKTTCIGPEFDLFGSIFGMNIPDTRIVKSSYSGFWQHNAVSWYIDHGHLAYSQNYNPVSKWLCGFVGRWIASISVEDRIVFVNELFDSLGAGGAKTLKELTSEDAEGRKQIRTALQNTGDTTKHIIFDLTRQALFQNLVAINKKKDE